MIVYKTPYTPWLKVITISSPNNFNYYELGLQGNYGKLSKQRTDNYGTDQGIGE